MQSTPFPAANWRILRCLACGLKSARKERRSGIIDAGSSLFPTIVKLMLGRYPAHSIAAARQWAAGLNEHVEAGIDPRVLEQEAIDRAKMTVKFSHGLYMAAVREGRASRAKRVNKPRTIADKLAIYNCDIAPRLASKVIYDVTEGDLTKLVLGKGKRSRVHPQRLEVWRRPEGYLPRLPCRRVTDPRTELHRQPLQ